MEEERNKKKEDRDKNKKLVDKLFHYFKYRRPIFYEKINFLSN